MVDFILVVVLLVIIGAAVIYIRKAKKKGVKCIGCPVAGECAHKNKTSGCGGCGSDGTKTDCNCHADTK